MRKHATYILLLLVWVHGYGQTLFSGRLAYTIEYLNIPVDMKGVEKQLPTTISVISDGSNWRSVQYTEINGEYAQVYDHARDSIFEMITIGPEKVRVSHRTLKKVMDSKVKGGGTEVLNNATVIADVQLETGDHLSVIQLKDYLPIPNLFYQGLSGVPVSVEIENAGVLMRLTLIKIQQEPIDETYFTLPDDYRWVDNSLYQSWLR